MSLSRLRPEITKTNRMEFNLKIWRQKNAKAKGHFETYHIEGIEEDASFLEMLDILNEQIIREGCDPIAVERGCQSSGPVSFDHLSLIHI